jgi:hypothetical protein
MDIYQTSTFWCSIDKQQEYNKYNYYIIVVLNFAYSTGQFFHTILLEDPMIDINML